MHSLARARGENINKTSYFNMLISSVKPVPVLSEHLLSITNDGMTYFLYYTTSRSLHTRNQ